MSARSTRTYRTFVAPRPPAHLRDLALPRHARHREVDECGASAYTCSHVSVPLSRLLTLSTHCSPSRERPLPSLAAIESCSKDTLHTGSPAL
uniref:Uncharacterized protein n=1 Tax=Caenorhabditis japonica TaxID=281687 RepID=A0A8R1ISV8_CAEJA